MELTPSIRDIDLPPLLSHLSLDQSLRMKQIKKGSIFSFPPLPPFILFLLTELFNSLSSNFAYTIHSMQSRRTGHFCYSDENTVLRV